MIYNDFLFRYRTYDKKAIDALDNDRLYFSTPEMFNDPYDSLFYINKESFFQIINDELDNNMEKYLKYFKCLQQVYEKIVEKTKDFNTRNQFYRHVSEIVQSIKIDMRRNLKIICFSEDYLSTLMWAHYADYHKGFCIMYNRNKLKKAHFFNSENVRMNNTVDLRKVNYLESQTDLGPYLYDYIPKKSLGIKTCKLEVMNSLIKSVIGEKSNEWKYEKEWRIIPEEFDISETNGISYLSVKADAIFLGCEMSIENKYELVYCIIDK